LYGPFNPELGIITNYVDVTRKELLVISPLILGTLIMGISPEIFLHPIHGSASELLQLTTRV